MVRSPSPALRAAALVVGMFLAAGAAQAHKASDSYLSLALDGNTIAGRWDIALRDLEEAVGIDVNGDRAVTWGELRASRDAIAGYALARLALLGDSEPCPTGIRGLEVDRHTDGAYAVLRFAAVCSGPVRELEIGYALLFDLDPLHRGLLRIDDGETVHSGVLGPDDRILRIETESPRRLRQFLTYLREGVHHIWIGIDHILFLVTLLLPAVLRLRAGAWLPVARFRDAGVEVVKVVTAFTLAHSITLTVATLGWLDLPARLVEPAIAASIVVAALNNLYPVVTRRLWLMAFGFGLIHGLGFAGVLAGLGLPPGALMLSLAAFNLGVEAGQLAIVLVFLPLAYLLRRTQTYPRLGLQVGSGLIASIGAIWLIERSLEITLFA